MKIKKCDHIIGLENPEEYDNDGLIHKSTEHKFNINSYTILFNFCPDCGEKLKQEEEND